MTEPTKRPSSGRTTMLAYVGIVAAAAVFFFALHMANTSSSSTPSSTPRPASTSSWRTVPEEPSKEPEVVQLEREGYNIVGGVGIRFLNDVEKQGRTCSLGSCTWVKVASIDGCSGVYVEANILDDDGTIVDWTNATGSRMRAGDEAILELSKYRTTGSTFRLTEVNCH